jgi:SAM-dependent methyltransferase
MFPTYGSLDSAAVEDGELFISGWVATKGAGAVEGLRVRSGSKVLPRGTAELNLPSPDVQAVFPGLDEVDRCRFRLRVPLSTEERDEVRTSLLSVTPLVRGREGGVLTHIIDTTLPPPREEDIVLVGGGSVLGIAFHFFSCFVELAGLTPESDVLDIGCGFGRIAHALVRYLSPTARYEGFDVVGRMIDWARESITPRYPNFRFTRVDLYNKTYNLEGTLQSSEFRFPYEDEGFDLVFLTSVFTHMFGRDIRHYLDEIRRVLRPGGRCLATCFLLNEESESLIRQGRSTQSLTHPVEDGFVADPECPEDAIGFPEPMFLGWIAGRGLTVQGNYYGAWCGRSDHRYYQDMIIFMK